MDFSAPTRFYYKPSAVLPRYLGQAGLLVLGLWSPFPTTYFGYLDRMPGILFLYGLAAILAFALFIELPTFVRALFRIPAVEFDGETLLIRGWEDRSFNIATDREFAVRVDDRERILVTARDRKSACLYSPQIEGPKTVARFFDALAENRAP